MKGKHTQTKEVFTPTAALWSRPADKGEKAPRLHEKTTTSPTITSRLAAAAAAAAARVSEGKKGR